MGHGEFIQKVSRVIRQEEALAWILSPTQFVFVDPTSRQSAKYDVKYPRKFVRAWQLLLSIWFERLVLSIRRDGVYYRIFSRKLSSRSTVIMLPKAGRCHDGWILLRKVDEGLPNLCSFRTGNGETTPI